MRWSTPTVRHGSLILPGTRADPPITLGTPAWYAWLETATLFSFVSEHGTFTARKERRQRGGWYWKAYRTQQGKLARVYLGKTEHLTLERLEQGAQALIERGSRSTALPPGTRRSLTATPLLSWSRCSPRKCLSPHCALVSSRDPV